MKRTLQYDVFVYLTFSCLIHFVDDEVEWHDRKASKREAEPRLEWWGATFYPCIPLPAYQQAIFIHSASIHFIHQRHCLRS